MLEVQSIEPDSVWVKTNPAWCYHEFKRRLYAKGVHPRTIQPRLRAWIEQVQNNGVRFPGYLWENFFCFAPTIKWEAPTEQPRVVGLLRSRADGQTTPTGFVTQVKAESCSSWSVSDGLPFKVGHIQDAFSKLINVPGTSLEMIVPEAKPFNIIDTLGQTSEGSSMNIAGLLAVIDAWNGHKGTIHGDPLQKACSLVKPLGKKLVDVGGIREKIGAFEREYGHGSLVVCTAAASEKFDLKKRFKLVWDVEDFESLAQYLCKMNLLEPIFENRQLTNQYVNEASQILAKLNRTEGPKVALDFSHRLARAAKRGGVESLRVEQRVNATLEDFNRHIGNFSEAVRFSQQALQAHRSLGDRSSFQEEVEVKSRLASAMLDAHQFDEAKQMLKDLLGQHNKSPRSLNAEARVILFNTLARLLVLTGEPGWENLFEKSMDLQSDFDPSSIGRTRCYLVHGLLRTKGKTEDVKQALAWFEENETDPYTASFVNFYQAELYRQDPTCGNSVRQKDSFERHGSGHPLGFYFIATGLQPDRDPDDREHRLSEAIRAFSTEIGENKENNILHLFSLFTSMGLRGVDESATRTEIAYFFETCPTHELEAWYADALNARPFDFESLLCRIPYL